VKPTIRRADDWDDAIYFANHLRPADARELQTAHPTKQIVHILSDAIRSGETYTARFGKYTYPCVLFGVAPVEAGIVAPVEAGIGIIWMVCTDDIKGHAISILREARHWIQYWKHDYSLLANCVETRNKLHVRWLKALGARFDHAYLRNGVVVRPFYL
jgi:hypothetical protein